MVENENRCSTTIGLQLTQKHFQNCSLRFKSIGHKLSLDYLRVSIEARKHENQNKISSECMLIRTSYPEETKRERTTRQKLEVTCFVNCGVLIALPFDDVKILKVFSDCSCSIAENTKTTLLVISGYDGYFLWFHHY